MGKERDTEVGREKRRGQGGECEHANAVPGSVKRTLLPTTKKEAY